MSESNTLEEFREKFRVPELLVLDNGAWSWSVRPAQPTLGSGILSLNRFAGRLAEVTPEEMAQLAGLVKTLEAAIRTCFGHDIMNYLMLMMVDHHVHYHVLPRYAGKRQFDGLDWTDGGWPKPPLLSDSQHPESVHAIRDALRAAIERLAADPA